VNFSLLVPLLVTTLVAIAGWIVAHRFAILRERAGKRRELQVKYLIEAYRKLERAAHREVPLPTNPEDLETAIADIHLLGSAEQVRLAQDFVREFTETKRGDISDLLISLRHDLRRELGLEEVQAKVAFLRISREPAE
jgi:hypothetical protein